MLFSLILIVPVTLSSAFVPRIPSVVSPPFVSNRIRKGTARLHESKGDDDFWSAVDPVKQQVTNALGAAFVAAALWASPASLAGPAVTSNSHQHVDASWVSVASAKEMASGSGSRVNKDPESLLRYGLPVKNKEVRSLQESVEDIRLDIGSKRKSAALDGVRKSKTIISQKASKMVPACRDAKTCNSILAQMTSTLDPLENALKESSDAFQGSEQERDALDKAYAAQDDLQKQLTSLEEQMVPAGYKTPVPDDYLDLPQLEGGRATVEMVIKRPDGTPFRVKGQNFPLVKMTMVIDGFTAPVTGGNFIDLVNKGFYNNMPIQRSDGFVVQTGDPEGEADGYVATPSKSIGGGSHGERLIPLEIFVKGDDGPFYETTIEDEGRGGQATVLPFSSYGAMGWAREEYDANSGSSQFFWLLFDSDLTPAGKNVLDGRYPCFGYVVEGSDYLSDVKEGDVITSAKVTSGLQFLRKTS